MITNIPMNWMLVANIIFFPALLIGPSSSTGAHVDG